MKILFLILIIIIPLFSFSQNDCFYYPKNRVSLEITTNPMDIPALEMSGKYILNDIIGFGIALNYNLDNHFSASYLDLSARFLNLRLIEMYIGGQAGLVEGDFGWSGYLSTGVHIKRFTPIAYVKLLNDYRGVNCEARIGCKYYFNY